MSRVIHAFDLLESPEKYPPAPLTVLFGDEWLLRKLVLDQLRASLYGDEDVPEESLDGTTVEWRDLRDELSTVSLFGGGRPRLVVLHDADKFVSAHRAELEAYANETRSRNVLVLLVSSFPGNTRLYKIVQARHLAVACNPPTAPRRTKTYDRKRIVKWLVRNASERHEAKLPAAAAEIMYDLLGADFGRLDNETEKLAVFVGPGGTITAEIVRDMVGGWRARTTWDMIDAALDGNAPAALAQLRDLLDAGEQPIGLCAQLAWSLRQMAAAARFVQRSEQMGRRPSLSEALRYAGVQQWSLEKAERHLKQIGRVRAGELYQWALETDLALKGSHSNDSRARWALEQLILRLSAPLAPPRAAPRAVAR